MPDRKTTLALLTVIGASLLSLQIGATDSQSDPRAVRLLLKALDRFGPKNVIAIMQFPGKEGKMMQSKVIISKDGKQHVTMLQPLQAAGYEIVDIGDRREMYNPDKGTLTVTRSPLAQLVQPSIRIKLIKRNYKISFEDHFVVAGRRAVRLTAKATNPEMGGSIVYVDPWSDFVMRIEKIDDKGHKTRTYDTIQVWYPETLPPSSFNIRTRDRVRTEDQDVPEKFPGVSRATRLLGFRPLLPKSLPMGFIVQAAYLRNKPDFKGVELQLSDGMANATIYEIALSSCPQNFRDELRRHPDMYAKNGTTLFTVYGDVSMAAKKRLLRAVRMGARN